MLATSVSTHSGLGLNKKFLRLPSKMDLDEPKNPQIWVFEMQAYLTLHDVWDVLHRPKITLATIQSVYPKIDIDQAAAMLPQILLDAAKEDGEIYALVWSCLTFSKGDSSARVAVRESNGESLKLWNYINKQLHGSDDIKE